MSEARQSLIQGTLLLAFLAVLIAGRQARFADVQHESERPLLLPNSTLARAGSLGYERLASDFYWLDAIQYYGSSDNEKKHFPDLARLLDLVTDLDPQFAYAYRFGGVTLPTHTARGWVNTREAAHLLEKGMEHRPDVWQIGMLLGFARLWYFDDVVGSAAAVEHAAQQKGAPAYLPLLATRLRAHSHTPEMGLRYARLLLEQTDDPSLRAELQGRVAELETEIVLQGLERAVERFRTQFGRPPFSLDELFVKLLLRPPPGGVEGLTYDPVSGTVSSERLPRRLVLPPEAMKEAADQRAEGAAP